MGVLSFVGSCISSVAGAIGSAVSSAVSVIANPELTILKGLENLAKILGAVAKILGVILEDEEPEELGDRALQAEKQGITPEQFESHKEYMKKLKELDLDEELSKKFSKEEKLTAAASVLVMGIQEKAGVDFGSEMKFCSGIVKNPSYFTAERVSTLLKEIAKTDYTMDQVADFFDKKGSLSVVDTRGVRSAVLNAEKTLNPNANEETIYNHLDNLEK